MMASGSPFNPSQQAMSTLATPRLHSSVRTLIQCLAPSSHGIDPEVKHFAHAPAIDAEHDADWPVGDLTVPNFGLPPNLSNPGGIGHLGGVCVCGSG
jgi:hypothetical protein